MSTGPNPASEELRVIEYALSVVEARIKARMDACTFCDQGTNAYAQAEHAIAAAFKDVRGRIHRVRNIARKKAGGS